FAPAIIFVPSLSPPGLSVGLSIIGGNVILVVATAIRCKIGFAPALAAWVIGLAVLFLALAILALILFSIAGDSVLGISDQYAFVLFLVIGAALLLNRWLARRRRRAEEAAAAAVVFD